MREATTCITERECPICYQALGDDSSDDDATMLLSPGR